MKAFYEYQDSGVRMKTFAVFEKDETPGIHPVAVSVPRDMTQKEMHKHMEKFMDIVYDDLREKGAKVEK